MFNKEAKAVSLEEQKAARRLSSARSQTKLFVTELATEKELVEIRDYINNKLNQA